MRYPATGARLTTQRPVAPPSSRKPEPGNGLAAASPVWTWRRLVSGHEATPVGGENGGRQTVRLRGGRAGSVTQESLVVFGASYHLVNRTQRLCCLPLCCRTAGPSVESRRATAHIVLGERFATFATRGVVNKISARREVFLPLQADRHAWLLRVTSGRQTRCCMKARGLIRITNRSR